MDGIEQTGALQTGPGARQAETAGPIVLFDGACNLCAFSVRFLAPRDRTGNLRFAAVQSATGRAILETAGLPTETYDSFILAQNGSVFIKSDAFFRVIRSMRAPWPLLGVGRILPARLADWLYDRVARNRYAIFGRRELCLVPHPELSRRFLP